MDNKMNFKAYALDQLREYLIINEITIEDKSDLKKIYLEMLNKGYFYKADVARMLDDVRDAISELGKAYEKNSDIVDEDLIFYGSKRVLEKMNPINKIKR